MFARLSGPLNALINGSSSEAIEKRAVWDDVSKQTFDRLREFAYRGDYSYDVSPPSPSFDEIRTFDGIDELSYQTVMQWKLPYKISDMDLVSWTGFTHNRMARVYAHDGIERSIPFQSKVQLAAKFRGWWYSDEGILLGHRDVTSPRPRSLVEYKKQLLCHAEMYAVAEKYCIKKLLQVAATRLHRMLLTFTIYEESIEAIATCMHYVLQHSPPDSSVRSMLVILAAILIEDVVDHDDFSQMLADNPDFTVEVRKVTKSRVVKG